MSHTVSTRCSQWISIREGSHFLPVSWTNTEKLTLNNRFVVRSYIFQRNTIPHSHGVWDKPVLHRCTQYSPAICQLFGLHVTLKSHANPHDYYSLLLVCEKNVGVLLFSDLMQRQDRLFSMNSQASDLKYDCPSDNVVTVNRISKLLTCRLWWLILYTRPLFVVHALLASVFRKTRDPK